MRFVVCLLVLLATFVAALFAWFWLDYFTRPEVVAAAKDYVDLNFVVPPPGDLDSIRAAAYLALAVPLGFLAALCVLFRRGWQAAILLLLAAAGPAALNVATLMFV